MNATNNVASYALKFNQKIVLDSMNSSSESDEMASLIENENDEHRLNNVAGQGDDSYADQNFPSARKPGSLCFVYTLTLLSAIGGFLFGYDTGVISGAMILIQPIFGLSTLWTELIVSITIGAAALFAMLGGVFNSYLGRKPTILIASTVFTVGAIVMGVANDKEVLLVGRLIVGIGIGMIFISKSLY